jgi:hypothetical protein
MCALERQHPFGGRGRAASCYYELTAVAPSRSGMFTRFDCKLSRDPPTLPYLSDPAGRVHVQGTGGSRTLLLPADTGEDALQ